MIGLEVIRKSLALKRRQREESLVALQQIENKGNEVRQRILCIDGAVAQLMEFEAHLQQESAANANPSQDTPSRE